MRVFEYVSYVLILQANDQRLEDAKAYLQSLQQMERAKVTDVVEQYDLVIVVITMNRDAALNDNDRQIYRLGYLTQTVARLLQIVHADISPEFQHKKLIVCNVDAHPSTFTEALDLSDHVQVVSRYQNRTAKLHDIMTENVFEKEKDDYMYCLQTAGGFLSRYYLVLEDDVLLEENAIETLYFMMNYFDLFAAVDWLFVKLYYPEKWSGYDWSSQTVAEIGSYSLLVGSLCAGVALLLPVHRKWSWSCRTLPLWFRFMVGAVFAALVCLSIGRQHVESWRSNFVSTHRLTEASGCCTQATLYAAHLIPDLSAHLGRVRSTYDFAVDIAVNGFAHIRGLKCYRVEPNIIKHIGLLSTIGRNSKSAKHFL